MIKINKLDKFYNKGKNNEIHVINNASLELPNYGLISFLGQSGSGKTTLLNVIGGLDKAKGEIVYDNVEFKNYNMSKVDKFRMKNIGYIFQNYNLLPNISVYENIELGLNLIGIYDKEEIEKRVSYCLNAVGMLKFKKRKALALSGGQQQRVSIARALAKNSNIIIADEPTGNLDSQNTIEVMNILKKISETKLVLLVTHDKDIANFYSDKIVELKDGEITSYSDNQRLYQSLETKRNNDIYLHDLKNSNINNNEVDYTLYYDNEIEEKLDFTIVYKNNTIYLQTNNKNIKIVDVNTEIKLIEDSYKPIAKDMIVDFKFDTTDFTQVEGRNFDFRLFFKNIKTSFNSILQVKAISKIFYLFLLIIGIIMCTSIVYYSTAVNINTDTFSYERDGYLPHYKDFYNRHKETDKYSQELMEVLNTTSLIDDISALTETNPILISNLPINVYPKDTSYLLCNYRLLEDKDLMFGRINIKNNEEVVIDKTIGDFYIKEYKRFINLKLEDLIGMKIDEKEIIGIVNKRSKAIYVKDYLKLAEYNADSEIYSTNMTEYKNEFINYEVVYGTDLDMSTDEKEILVNVKELITSNINYQIGGHVRLETAYDSSIKRRKTEIFYIVGFFKSDEITAKYISNDIETRKEGKYVYESGYSDMYNFSSINNVDYILTEGKTPVNNDEILVSMYSSYNVGDIIPGYQVIGYRGDVSITEYKVAGKYYSTGGIDDFLISNNIYLFCMVQRHFYNRSLVVFSKNIDEYINLMNIRDFDVIKSYDSEVEDQRFRSKNEIENRLIICIVLLLVVIIYVFFTMRAKMINKIYDIGVYRALGANRKKIVGDFLVELLILTTITTLLGYVGCAFVYYLISKDPLVGESIVVNYTHLGLGIGLIYAINLFFGLLPIFSLLRKTPAQIIAKYDI